MTKAQAKDALMQGMIVYHDYYSENEYITFDGNVIRDENHYNMGSFYDHFWSTVQKWQDGWHYIEFN